MSEMPEFDPEPPSTEPPSPKKPRRKPQRQKRPAKAAVVMPKRPAKAAVVMPKRRVPKKRARKPAKPVPRPSLVEEMKNDFVAFIKALYGFELEPWQERLLKALGKPR
jgi:hypothetical protein